MIPIILCGGVGQRVWPVSRAATPKPFMPVAGKSLLRRAVARASAMPADHLIEREDEFAQAAVADDEVSRTARQLVMPWQS